MNTRKRLKLMPEVLPDPRQGNANGSVRTRTLAHVQRLLAGAAAATAAACANEPAPTVAPITGEGSRGEADAGAVATIESADPKPSATVAPTASIPPEVMTGYAVVDPMPPPSACPGLAAHVPHRATWKMLAGGPAVEVVLSKATGPEVVSYANSVPNIYGGGSVQSQSGGGDSLRFQVKVASGTTSLSLGFAALCNGRPVNFSVGLDVQKMGRHGDPVPMQLSSY